MKRYVSSNSSWSSSSRFRICAWIETSSAETGSSHDDQRRVDGERAGDADPLPLPAGELVRVAGRGVGAGGRRRSSSSRTRVAVSRCARRDAVRLHRLGEIRPTLCRGLSEANGSWKTICIRRRSGRSCASDSVRDVGRRRRVIRPAVGSYRRRIARPTVDLPQPDSPTSPSVSPRSIVEASRRRPPSRRRRGGRARARS